jgi:hypothetical protein
VARVEIGVWRSTLGDTWPHTGIEVALDYWPQSTHLVADGAPLVVCATGGGGGSQQAMFRRELDPLLAAALARWNQRRVPDAVDALDQLFREIQHGFETATEPFYADELQASAVGLLADGDGCAVVSIGLERAWRWRAGALAQVSIDYTLADLSGAPADLPDLPAFLRESPGACFGRWRDAKARWQLLRIDARPGDVFVLASGIRHCNLTAADLAGELAGAGAIAAQALAIRLGELAVKRAGEDRRLAWSVHSRLAIGVVTI